MLLQFVCSNHKSIREPILFSMLASKQSDNEERMMSWNGMNFLRAAAIYGANGSGKSNFINAIAFAKKLVVSSILNQPGDIILQTPHKTIDNNTPSRYEFQFTKDNLRYSYGFSIKNNYIDEEFLYYFPNNRQKKIFERKEDRIEPGSSYKNKFQIAKEVLTKNRLFLSCLSNYSQIDEAIKAFLFFKEDLIIYKTNTNDFFYNNSYDYSMLLIEKNKEVKESFLKILKMLDTGIVDVKAKIKEYEDEEVIGCVQNNTHNNFFEATKRKNFATVSQVNVAYESFVTDLFSEESTGVQKLFQIICPLLNILEEGKVFVCDEFESGLHELIILKLVQLFYNWEKLNNAQIVFTTHNTNILTIDMLNRDQVWFTQLTKGRATEIYSLIEIKNVRKDENFARWYMRGKYGAIPDLNTGLFD